MTTAFRRYFIPSCSDRLWGADGTIAVDQNCAASLPPIGRPERLTPLTWCFSGAATSGLIHRLDDGAGAAAFHRIMCTSVRISQYADALLAPAWRASRLELMRSPWNR